jgi:DNA-binding response OmpR family regulator
MTTPSRILLVDDDFTILETLKIIIEENGYLVDTAQTGKEAIEKSFSNFYNLAIVDWRLPDIEGTKLLNQFRETTPKMMKIMLTGYPSMQNAMDSVNAQADAFFQKPISAEVLLEKIKTLLIQQEQSKKFDQDKIAVFIQSRANELRSAQIQKNNP